MPGRPYRDFDFASETAGAAFDCAGLLNRSPHNTGLEELPPLASVDLWYGATRSAEFPELGTGGVAPMAGPVYHFDDDLESSVKWPESYDEGALFYEWTRDAIFVLRLTEEGALDSIERPADALPVDNPIDMEFGPDGALYVLEYGDGYYRANSEAQLARFDYVRD